MHFPLLQKHYKAYVGIAFCAVAETQSLRFTQTLIKLVHFEGRQFIFVKRAQIASQNPYENYSICIASHL